MSTVVDRSKPSQSKKKYNYISADSHLEMLHEIREELRSLRHNPQSG